MKLNYKIVEIRKKLKELGAKGVIIFKPENRRYITGFTGTTGYGIITGDDMIFATDFRYIQQSNMQCKGFKIQEIGRDYTIFDLLVDMNIDNLAVEDDFITYNTVRTIENKGINILPLNGFITKLRMIKTDEEINIIKKAAEITDLAYEDILNKIKPGVSEREIVAELEYFMKRKGADGPSFEFIVASGKRSSMPHGVASDKKIENGDFITIDMGCIYKGYCSDFTRTFVVGKANDEQRKIYNIVLKAQLAVIDNIRPGISGFELDKIARDIIGAAGYGGNFGHGLGHGVGLEIHELPTLSPLNKKTINMKPGMIITDEPGIYIPDFGGVRIEDLILVTENGCEILSKANKELLEI